MNPLPHPCLTPMLALVLILSLPALADPAKGQPSDDRRGGWDDDGRDDWHAEMQDWPPEFAPPPEREFRVIALRRAIQIVGARFQGRVIAARLTGPSPDERARGAVLVHELRLLTPARDVLRIRLDARSGDFLDVAGRGLTRARKTRKPR